jgi:hypothetical protein
MTDPLLLGQDFELSENNNLLQPTKFKLVLGRFPNLVYFCQETELPGISLPSVIQPSPFADRPMPGDKLVYDDLPLTFMVDENLQNWLELHNWLRALGKPTTYVERQSLRPPGGKGLGKEYCDASVMILSSHNNPTYEIQYKDCFPINLTPIRWSTQSSANQVLVATVVLKYLYYDIIKVN